MISLKSCRHGIMAFNTNDMYVGRSFQEYGEFSQGEVDLFSALIKPGMTVLDVGANIGAHSVVMGRLVGPTGNVLAFEPQRICYYMLCANVVLNELTNVLCLQNAVGNGVGRIFVPELNPNAPNNFGGLELTGDYQNVHGHSVKMVRIDDFNLPACDFIKGDVEGMEIDVLLGASKTIEKYRPIIYVEAHKKEKTTALIRMIRNKGYKTLVHAPLLFNPKNHSGNQTNLFVNIASINLFAYPSEKPCPIDVEAFEMQEVGRDRTFMVIGTPPHEAMRTINETETAIIQGFCSMADSYAERLFDPDKAMMYLHKAIELTPDDWRLYNRALPILSRFMKYEEALDYANLAIEKGGNIDVVFNKGIILWALGRAQEAIECYDQVLEFRPDCPETHFNRGVDLLKLGRYKEGWEEYEWRFKRGNQALLELIGFLPERPKWNGEPLDGKRILLFIEQGAGDQIQFIRYAKQVKERGGHVIVACYPALEEIVRNVEGVDEVVVHGDDISLPDNFDCDVMCSLLSLPRIFGTDETNIPAEVPYISVPKTDKFYELDNDPAFLVGLCWAGSETHSMDFCRSCELKHFNPLANIAGAKFVNLQMSTSKRHWQQCGSIDLAAEGHVPMVDLRSKIKDYRDTADLLNRLDLVITVDTSLAHLAGAMGKEVWVALGRNSDWRWLLEGDKTQWYPTMRLFRGDSWETVFADIETALKERLHPEAKATNIPFDGKVKKASRKRKS